MHRLEIQPNLVAKGRIDEIYELLLRQPYFGDLIKLSGDGKHPDVVIYSHDRLDQEFFDWHSLRTRMIEMPELTAGER